ncbi:MAG: hypothetical protein K1W06_02600 [Lachnospiraceae bacterium]
MNSRKNILKAGVFLLMAGLFFLLSTQSQAAVKKLNILDGHKKKSCQVDLDGDGKKEKLSLSVKYENDYILEAVLYVNGKKAAVVPDAQGEYDIKADYIKMSDSGIFIRCQTSGDSYVSRSDYFYKYNPTKKKLVKGTKLLDVNESSSSAQIKAVTNSEVKVKYKHQLDVVGHISWTATYVVKDGQLKLKPSVSKAKNTTTTKYGDPDGYGRLLEKNQYKCKYDINLYKNTNMKKIAYTTKPEDILTLKRIKYTKDDWYVQFEKDGKIGWVNLKGFGSREIFYGINARMAG